MFSVHQNRGLTAFQYQSIYKILMYLCEEARVDRQVAQQIGMRFHPEQGDPDAIQMLAEALYGGLGGHQFWGSAGADERTVASFMVQNGILNKIVEVEAADFRQRTSMSIPNNLFNQGSALPSNHRSIIGSGAFGAKESVDDLFPKEFSQGGNIDFSSLTGSLSAEEEKGLDTMELPDVTNCKTANPPASLVSRANGSLMSMTKYHRGTNPQNNIISIAEFNSTIVSETDWEAFHKIWSVAKSFDSEGYWLLCVNYTKLLTVGIATSEFVKIRKSLIDNLGDDAEAWTVDDFIASLGDNVSRNTWVEIERVIVSLINDGLARWCRLWDNPKNTLAIDTISDINDIYTCGADVTLHEDFRGIFDSMVLSRAFAVLFGISAGATFQEFSRTVGEITVPSLILPEDPLGWDLASIPKMNITSKEQAGSGLMDVLMMSPADADRKKIYKNLLTHQTVLRTFGTVFITNYELDNIMHGETCAYSAYSDSRGQAARFVFVVEDGDTETEDAKRAVVASFIDNPDA